jgi:hypothetical protein
MTDGKPTPLLTPTEAETHLIVSEFGQRPLLWVTGSDLDYDNSGGEYSASIPAQKVAALCLHGQPFGFAVADVQLLRSLAVTHPACEAHASGLADRIEALLPPEESSDG